MKERVSREELEAHYSRTIKIDIKKAKCDESSVDDLGILIDSSESHENRSHDKDGKIFNIPLSMYTFE